MANPLVQRWDLRPVTPPTPTSVYMGDTYSPGFGIGGNPYQTHYEEVGVVKQTYNLLDEADRVRLKNIAAMQAAYPKDKWGQYPEGSMQSFWEKTVDQTRILQSTTGLRVQPLDYWDWYYRNQKGGALSAGTGSGGGGGGSGSAYGGVSHSQSTTVDLTNPDSAKQLVNDALARYLGRDANDQELAAFTQALNAREKQSPRKQSGTTVTTGTAQNSNSSTTGTNSGGTSPTQFAEDWARGQEGSAEYQAATRFMDVFMNAIKAPV
jgi:hypothetical protein